MTNMQEMLGSMGEVRKELQLMLISFLLSTQQEVCGQLSTW